jgi:alkaline phosphatase D
MAYLALFIVGFLSVSALDMDGVHQATGVKVGEVSATSAIVWVRLTGNSFRNADGPDYRGRGHVTVPEDVGVDTLEGECPGMQGRVRLWYGLSNDLGAGTTTDWVDVNEKHDFTHQFHLEDLRPGSTYSYAVETKVTDGTPEPRALRGGFQTAPPPDERGGVTFAVITGQAYVDLDHAEGFHIYESMAQLEPNFLVATGDTVYYDSEDPMATTVPVARYHWHRMYSLPRHVAFHLSVPGYWIKDDHDTVVNDCWPGQDVPRMLPMTFADGQKVFREQVPMGEKTYRTYRWGKALQIWLVEGRDFRSPNTMKDGPEKTIWGEEQKQWLKDSLLESDADWRVLISATPIVGPDRKNKADNHANAAFAHEGNEFRQWVQENVPANFFVVCGDRHWQYHSVHPETGVHEFSCGPASDQHAAGTPGENPKYHRFHRVKGGFLSVAVNPHEPKSSIAFRFHDVHGEIVYEFAKETE